MGSKAINSRTINGYSIFFMKMLAWFFPDNNALRGAIFSIQRTIDKILFVMRDIITKNYCYGFYIFVR